MRFVEVLSSGPALGPAELQVRVVVAAVQPREAARTLQDLSARLPLHAFKLEHLKRIRSSKQEGGANLLEIIVCPEADFEASVPEDIKSSLTGAHVVSVARFAPHSRPEFLEWGQLWPIQFRPSETDRSREQGLDDKETARLSRYIEMLEAIDKLLEGETGLKNQGVIIVNPSNGAIITTSHCAFTEEVSLRGREAALAHPLHTPVMRCINDVGNVLVNRPPDRFSHLPVDQYLCTGLDLYASMEPDLLSSMALVHSRIHCVVYRESDPARGCLGSRAAIHCMRTLNHRFQVFRVAKEHEDEEKA